MSENVIEGIVDIPSKETYVLELVYGHAISMKKLFSMLSAFNKGEGAVSFIFTKNSLLIGCKDHHGKMLSNIIIPGSNCLRYFCKNDNLSIDLTSTGLSTICTIIKKKFGKMSIYLKEKNYTEEMIVCLYEEDGLTKDKKPILVTLTGKTSKDELFKNMNQSYHSVALLDTANFKRRLTTFHKIGSVFANIIMEKDKVTFDYKNGDTLYVGKSVVEKCVTILDETCTKTESICEIEYLLGIFKTIVSAKLYLLISRDGNMCLNFYLDEPENESRIKNYTYLDNINGKKNGIIIRMFVEK